MRRRLLSLLLGPLLVPFAVLVAGCPQPAARGGRALVIGVDGASHRMVDAMIAAAELPNLARIRDRGVYGRMRPEGPLLSPRIWTSFATGLAPKRHGIESWVWFDEEHRPHLYSSDDRRVPALWNILSNAGRSVAVVNWLITHPPEQVAGVVLSDHVLPAFSSGQVRIARQFAARSGEEAAPEVERAAPGAPAVYPETWVERIELLRTGGASLSSVPNPFSAGEDIENPGVRALSRLLWESFENDGIVARMALSVERELRPDLTLVYLPGIDRVSHLLWPQRLYFDAASAADDETTDDRDRVHFDWLRDYYRYVDDLVGALAQGYGDDDLVVVLSDHAFERAPDTDWPPGRHDSDAAREGVFFARGPGVRTEGAAPVVSMLDLTPSLLAWLGLPVADDMPGDTDAFIEWRAAERIPTYGTLPERGERRERGGAADEDARIEGLRMLGYVD